VLEFSNLQRLHSPHKLYLLFQSLLFDYIILFHLKHVIGYSIKKVLLQFSDVIIEKITKCLATHEQVVFLFLVEAQSVIIEALIKFFLDFFMLVNGSYELGK